MRGVDGRLRKERLQKLAHQVEALSAKDDQVIRQANQVAEQRRAAAVGIHRICAGLVQSLNELLQNTVVELSPADYPPEVFQEDKANLLQINIRGLLLQIEFESTEPLISTENFRVPYILEGAIRCFNQELLDRDVIEEQSLFHTTEQNGNVWRFFDPRTYRTGVFDEDYLVSLLEQLV